MAKASDNIFPKLIVAEGSVPANPAAGQQKLYLDSADHKLKRVNSAGAVTTVEGGYTDEQARDAIGAALVAGTGMTITVDDAGDTITLAASGGGGGGLSQSYLGYNAIGASTVAPAIGNVYLKKITLAADGLLPSVEAYIANTADSVGSIGAAVNADSAGSPGSLLGYSMQPTTSFIPRPASGSNGPGRWLAVPLGIWLPAGDYWIAIMGIAGAITLAYDTGGSDRTYSTGGNAWFSDGGRYAISTTSNKYSIRAPHLH